MCVVTYATAVTCITYVASLIVDLLLFLIPWNKVSAYAV